MKWPHIVRVQGDLTKQNEAWLWIQSYCWDRDVPCSSVFTNFTQGDFGFKDPKIAMEFKLKFG